MSEQFALMKTHLNVSWSGRASTADPVETLSTYPFATRALKVLLTSPPAGCNHFSRLRVLITIIMLRSLDSSLFLRNGLRAFAVSTGLITVCLGCMWNAALVSVVAAAGTADLHSP
jgi:hypothetical protein